MREWSHRTACLMHRNVWVLLGQEQPGNRDTYRCSRHGAGDGHTAGLFDNPSDVPRLRLS